MNTSKGTTWMLVGSLMLLLGCEVSQTVSGKKVTYEMDAAVSKPEPEYKVWNSDEQNTVLYWRVPQNSLLTKRNAKNELTFNFRFRYKIYQNYSTKNPIDSGAVVLTDLPVDESSDAIEGQINLKLKKGLNYVLQVSLYDLNRNAEDVSLVDVLKAEGATSNYFEFIDPQGGQLFGDHTIQKGVHTVRCSLPVDKLWIKYYKRPFPIASAPFSTINPKPFDFNPDSLFVIKRRSDGVFAFDVYEKGFYQLVTDSSDKRGATLFHFGTYYPEQRTVQDLIRPMRYITTSQEFENLGAGGNPKQNVDEFWLKIGGSTERTRKIIQAYFNRVEYANEHFDSYLEGWKSDRGMCFIVFGQPDAVYRTTSSEKWIYGQSSRYNSLTLTFTKVMNPFTNSDFRLNRSSSLKTPWYRAVEFWRQGRVVNYR